MKFDRLGRKASRLFGASWRTHLLTACVFGLACSAAMVLLNVRGLAAERAKVLDGYQQWMTVTKPQCVMLAVEYGRIAAKGWSCPLQVRSMSKESVLSNMFCDMERSRQQMQLNAAFNAAECVSRYTVAMADELRRQQGLSEDALPDQLAIEEPERPQLEALSWSTALTMDSGRTLGVGMATLVLVLALLQAGRLYGRERAARTRRVLLTASIVVPAASLAWLAWYERVGVIVSMAALIAFPALLLAGLLFVRLWRWTRTGSYQAA